MLVVDIDVFCQAFALEGERGSRLPEGFRFLLARVPVF